MAKIEETVTEIAEPIVEENGLELVDVEFVKEGSEWFLRIFIDKEEGVTLDDCEKVSRVLSDKLDEVDPITQAYHLEVSSPGIERPLKKTRDFERFLQHPIQVKTFVPVEGRKKFKGTLEDVTLETITVNIDGNSLIIPRDKISKANLLWEG